MSATFFSIIYLDFTRRRKFAKLGDILSILIFFDRFLPKINLMIKMFSHFMMHGNDHVGRHGNTKTIESHGILAADTTMIQYTRNPVCSSRHGTICCPGNRRSGKRYRVDGA